MAVVCKNCGGSHPVWECRKESTAARKDVQSGGSKLLIGQHDGIRAPVNSGFGSHTSQGNPIAGTQAPPVDTKSRKSDRHRPGYMAAYMRKYRTKVAG